MSEIARENPKIYEEAGKKKQAKLQATYATEYTQHLQEQLAIKRQNREQERKQQVHLHTHSFPLVHHHPLARTDSLVLHGKPRKEVCDMCIIPPGDIFESDPSIYTCEECDLDICHDCFKWNYDIKPEKLAERLQKKEGKRRQEEEKQVRWDAQFRFKPNIIAPPSKNKSERSPLEYTVWSSNGLHGYGRSPRKEFDTSWKTKKEANDRAEYLFFWVNPWIVEPNEIFYDLQGDPKPKSRDGMDEWSASLFSEDLWTVGVMPAVAYSYLDI